MWPYKCFYVKFLKEKDGYYASSYTPRKFKLKPKGINESTKVREGIDESNSSPLSIPKSNEIL